MTPHELLQAISGGDAVVCWTKCEPCQWGRCPGGEHGWAGAEDLAHAQAHGQSADGACGYDQDGRPYIHSSWDEDESEPVR
jgi:hypothetical protein